MTLTPFQIISMIFFGLALVAFVAMVIIFRPGRTNKYNTTNK